MRSSIFTSLASMDLFRFCISSSNLSKLVVKDDKGDASAEATGPAQADISAGLQNLDDKGDASAEATGPAQADISAGLQNSVERRAVLLAYP
ncbi:hypothetical protein V6N13_037325 [Hibiscus sabdariffa]